MQSIDLIEPREYDFALSRLREFFRNKGFIETPVQHRLSILAACEDPRTIGTFDYVGSVWPLPQTGQMWLEYELLTKPDTPGFYCVSTSYRQEPDPIPGRHDLIFPMFEFETRGNIEALLSLEKELVKFLGFDISSTQAVQEYRDIAKRYGVKELGADEEKRMAEEFGPVIFLKHFPQYTSPFWNMKKEGDIAKKIDVLLYGVETIGSAERSTNPKEMRELFHTISGGMYADILYSKFGKERVEEELERFLSSKFFPRCGGGIGMTRLIKALKQAGVLRF